jgi:hypothetical protein
MKNYVINNGAFTANGNFSGYTALGVRVHLHKRQMNALGWNTTEDVVLDAINKLLDVSPSHRPDRPITAALDINMPAPAPAEVDEETKFNRVEPEVETSKAFPSKVSAEPLVTTLEPFK